MDLSFTPEHAAFRLEVRHWIEANFPQAIRDKQATGEHLNKEEIVSWHKILHAKGWLTPSWPKEHGGNDWDVVQRYIFSEELARANTSQPTFGLGMIGPVLFTFGSPEQKETRLKPTLAGDIWWCQG